MRKTALAVLALCLAPAAASAQHPPVLTWDVTVRYVGDNGVVFDAPATVYTILPGLAPLFPYLPTNPPAAGTPMGTITSTYEGITSRYSGTAVMVKPRGINIPWN